MLTLINLIYSIIIGLVQGIAEWLPISSKTQVLVASQYLFGLTYQQAYTFGLFMEIGTIVAAIIYFRKELVSLIRALMGSKDQNQHTLLVYVVVVTVVTGIIGAPLYIFADSLTSIPLGIPMIIIGLILILDTVLISYSRKKAAGGTNAKKLGDLKLKDYVFIGIAQGIAALPGVSRSGITTSIMLLMNVEADEAFRLSFLVGIFAAIAAFSLTLIATRKNVYAAITTIGVPGILVAMLTSTLVSLFLIDFLIKIVGKSKIVYVTGALGIIAIAGGALYLIFGI